MALPTPPSRSLSILPPNPTGFQFPPLDPEDGDSSDDESDFGDEDGHYQDDDYHSTRSDVSTSASLTSAFTSSLISSTSLPTTIVGTTLLTTKASSTLPASSTSSTTAPDRAAQSLNPGTIESIPQNEADPAIESRIMASPLGTAGIVLVAIFGFVALVTTFYLFFRMRRRRQAFPSSHQRTNTPDSHDSLEKGLPSTWVSTTQETGIIFGRRSPANERPTPASRGRGRFSFLNRRWYSTGSEATRAQHSRSSPPSPSRWGTGLLGLGLRTQTATPRSQSTSTSVLEAPYRSQTTSVTDVATSELRRNFSSSSGGDGHARAYAHHNVKAPRSVARSTMTSISSRLVRRKDREQTTPLPSPSKSLSEISEMYVGSRRTTMGSEKLVRSDTRTSFAVPPRIPLPVVSSEHRRLSNRSV